MKRRQPPPVAADTRGRAELLRRGVLLEYATIGWNTTGAAVTFAIAAVTGSPALTGLGLVSLVGIAEAWIAITELSGTTQITQQRAQRLMGLALLAVAACLLAQAMWVITGTGRPEPSAGGVAWSAASILVMLLLARYEQSLGRRLGHLALLTGAKLRIGSAALAGAVALGLGANAAFAWWWADPAAAFVIAAYSLHLGLVTLET